jgi:hypothetical protein
LSPAVKTVPPADFTSAAVFESAVPLQVEMSPAPTRVTPLAA